MLALACGEQEKKALPAERPAAVISASASPRPSPPEPQSAAAQVATCPEGMALVPGGPFWVGSAPSERFSDDESPRFRTELPSFCADVTEVTARAYDECTERGACTKARSDRVLCNSGRKTRTDHPVNCVTWTQAEAFCKARAARLPSEVEFEYLARGGEQYLKYPWGAEAPDGRTCWKHNGTCPVKTYAAGAFGLFDISGNVWEWTADWYGAYPWPPEHGFARVYRGGSFSRRFEKWMHTRLRNRVKPSDSGSHLGFRCVAALPGASCPFGAHADGRCRHGVHEVECGEGETWNGVRCAAPGEPRCATGRTEVPGYGCVRGGAPVVEGSDPRAEVANVKRERTPEFDADCRQNLRDRPTAFRYVGGTHAARNVAGRRDGCKNRDVGVGWNSACCP